jgi:hypothetical protein
MYSKGDIMSSKPKTKYQQFTLYLDPEIDGDKEIIDWLEKNWAKRNGYSSQIRKALKKIIDGEKTNVGKTTTNERNV